MRLDETFSKGSSPGSHHPAKKYFGVGGAGITRRKFFLIWFLCRQLRPIPAPPDPLNRAVEAPRGVSISIATSHVPVPRKCVGQAFQPEIRRVRLESLT